MNTPGNDDWMPDFEDPPKLGATPRTDAQGYGDGRHPYVSTEFARELERELAAERELADRLAEVIDGLDWITDPPQALAAYKAARDEARH